MKKSSKILGSVALSAALVMGTAAPAFADNPDNATDLQNGLNVSMDEGVRLTMNNGSSDMTSTQAEGASTLVQVGTYTSQINVTIPISLPLYFDTAGGSGIAPAAGKYKIENKSTADITVQSAKYAIKDGKTSEWAFGATSYATAGADTARKGGSVGDIFVAIAPQAGGTTLEMKAATGTTTNSSQSNLGWAISGNSSLGFEITPSSSQLSKSLTDFDTIASITYTVGVGTSKQPGGLSAGAPKNIKAAVDAEYVKVSDLKGLLGDSVKITSDGTTALSGITNDSYVKITKVERDLGDEVVDRSTNDTTPPVAGNYIVTASITAGPTEVTD